jgi:alkanesulfonate monooxygenase SsuD/methylene tetrahydromethanopterin reductase-like flavin-dependent oxidoreductase (luciferase family)
MPIGPAETFGNGWPVVQDAARQAGRDPNAIAASTYLTVSLHDDVDRANETLDEFLAAYYPAPPAVMRKLQATYAGPRDGLAAWVAEFVDAGAEHLILRFAGNHEGHLEACSSLRDELIGRS